MTLPIDMSRVQPVVDAVLYEGYILYPYRSSAAKNRQRWTFGGIYPTSYFTATDGAEPCRMQTQCLVEGTPGTRMEVRVRFLQPVSREVGELKDALDEWPQDYEPEFEPVRSLALGDRQFHTWQEAVERDVVVADCRLGELMQEGRHLDFRFDGRRELEPLRDDGGQVRGVLLHEGIDISGHIRLDVETVAGKAYRLTVRIENVTAMDPASVSSREEASLYSFASTHMILGAEDGTFVSLMDPPEMLREAAAACDNQGVWPVLVGSPEARDALLCSPITLYDYPEVAPESPGDLYDGTEIDEILSLNILAMTDDEKREMAATDPRTAALLARTEALTGDDFLRLHGVMRDRRPAATTLKVGDRVRLRPKPGSDIMDIALDGKSAVIEGIERDFEDRVHVAVTVEDDPGREWGLQRMPGHRFFFSPDEIEFREDETASRQVQA